MDAVRRQLIELVSFHCNSDKQTTVVPGLTLFRSERPTAPVRSLYNPRLCVVLQGKKEIIIDRNLIEISPEEYLVVVLDLPVSARVSQAGPGSLHYAVTLDLDPQIIAEIAAGDSGQSSPIAKTAGAATSAVTRDILEPLERLTRLLDRPEDIKTMAPLIYRELIYRLVRGGLGHMIIQSTIATSGLARIARTTVWIKSNFDKALSIATLAEMAGMSQTSYYRAFKSATAMSPLQFRTRLRLHEARRQLQLGGVKIGTVAYAVGYENQSQFSREYRKLFGNSPKNDLHSY